MEREARRPASCIAETSWYGAETQILLPVRRLQPVDDDRKSHFLCIRTTKRLILGQSMLILFDSIKCSEHGRKDDDGLRYALD